jgi:hypothetical protein
MQREELTDGDDAAALVKPEPEQITLVAGHQKIRRAGGGHRQKVVVVRVRADLDTGKVRHADAKIAQSRPAIAGVRRSRIFV